MRLDTLLGGPVAFLREEMGFPVPERLTAYQEWWEKEGWPLSLEVDRWGTPHLRQFNARGERVDEILYPPGYWYLLSAGYAAGVISEVARLRAELARLAGAQAASEPPSAEEA